MNQASQTRPESHHGAFFNKRVRSIGRPLIIAHRGYRACFPENTLCAFEQSLGCCDMIELDVQLSRDGVPVVFHDSCLDRTSDAKTATGSHLPGSLQLCDWTLAQLRQLDIGTWFISADPFQTLHQDAAMADRLKPLLPQRIMTLAEMLAWAGGSGMPLNVELKDQQSTTRDEQMVSEVIRMIRAANSQSEVALSSFNHGLLRLCSRLAPEIATAALQSGFNPPNLPTYLQDLAVCAYHPADAITDAPLIRTLRNAGLDVNVFTVNDQTRQEALFSWGACGIFTDFLQPPLPQAKCRA